MLTPEIIEKKTCREPIPRSWRSKIKIPWLKEIVPACRYDLFSFFGIPGQSRQITYDYIDRYFDRTINRRELLLEVYAAGQVQALSRAIAAG